MMKEKTTKLQNEITPSIQEPLPDKNEGNPRFVSRGSNSFEKTRTVDMINKINIYKGAIGGLIMFLFIVAVIIIISLFGDNTLIVSSKEESNPIAYTSCGKVEGLMEDSAYTFRGIPYARPPLGELRFKTVQPLDKLEYCWNGTFMANKDNTQCLQILGNGSIVGEEDCLTLDIVTPFVRYDNPLPVIVLISTDNLIGGSPGKLRPSARYARSRDLVFVRPNFRLGVLGFLALDILSEADYPKVSGNYGLSDILAALKWVQLNIEHFGGNKNAVTIFGHRAGATLVTALTTIPKANKYFLKAWASSGSAILPKKDLKDYHRKNRSYLNSVHCEDVACLKTLDAKKLMAAIEDTWRASHYDLPAEGETSESKHNWLVLDGKILKPDPDEKWESNERPVDLIIGTTAHSGSSEKLLMKHKDWNEELVKKHIQQSALFRTDLSEDIFKMYSLDYKGLSQMISDIRIVCPLLIMSSQMPKVSFYVVTQTRYEEDIADIDSDVDAILGRYEPRTPEQRRYFSAMQGLFYQYVWNDDIEPNFIGKKVLIVGQDVLPNISYSHCDYWVSKKVVPQYATVD